MLTILDFLLWLNENIINTRVIIRTKLYDTSEVYAAMFVSHYYYHQGVPDVVGLFSQMFHILLGVLVEQRRVGYLFAHIYDLGVAAFIVVYDFLGLSACFWNVAGVTGWEKTHIYYIITYSKNNSYGITIWPNRLQHVDTLYYILVGFDGIWPRVLPH